METTRLAPSLPVMARLSLRMPMSSEWSGRSAPKSPCSSRPPVLPSSLPASSVSCPPRLLLWNVAAWERPSLLKLLLPPVKLSTMSTKTASVERRRLGETVPLEAAVAACEAVDHVHHENCIYDVMATGDLEIAHAGV